MCSELWAQERTVSGTVTSVEDGSTLPGVNVLLQGTNSGVVTDIDGKYTIAVPQEGGILVFTFIGLATQEVEIGSRSTVDVQMASDVQQLSEVIVTGYGIERAAAEVTYQTEKIDGVTLMRGQTQIPAAGLVGKVAGLQINIQNNGVNPQAQILLRGLRSISSNNEAMIVIDGSVATLGAFNDLNPADIQSIDVLKGPSIGALYGSRASNGAIMVTTKAGKPSDTFTVGLNSSLTFEKVSFLPTFQSEHGIGWDGYYDPIENTNWGPRFDGQPRRIGPDFPDDYPLADQYVPYAPIQDNLKDFYERGSTFQNTVYLSGGDETSAFYFSYGREETTGIVPDDEYNSNSFRFNASKKIGKLGLTLSSSYFDDETNVVGSTIGDQDRPLYWFILNTPANIPLSSYKDWRNPLSYAHADNYYNAYYQNPYWAIGTNRDNDKTNRLFASLTTSYDITNKINLSGRLGINRVAGLGKNWRDAQTYNEELQPSHSAVSSFVEDYEFQDLELNGNAMVSGKFKLSEHIAFEPIVGAAFISTDNRSSLIRANNLSIPGFYDISNGTGELIATVDQDTRRTYGFFGDFTFGYKNWLFLNLAGRQDYTSTLPADNNGYFYPAASLSFVASEAFPSIVESGILSSVKATATKAIVYNDLGVYQLNERYFQPEFFPMGDLNGFEAARTVVDADIKKEKLDTWEFGLNLGLLHDRFYFDAVYYKTVTTDLITETTPSYASGALRYLTNIGEMSNTGYEFTLGGNLLKVGDFSWDFNVNYTHYETIVESIKDDLKEIALDNYGTYGTFAIVGEAFPQVKAQSYVRDPEGRVVINPANGNPLIGEVIPQGKTTPDYIIGGSSELTFKGISLSATVDYRSGHIYYAQGFDAMEFTGRSVESVSSDRQDFVFPNSSYETPEGFVENTNIPVTGGRMNFWQNTYNEIKENYVKDATAFKIREVALNYTLPQSIVSRIGFVKKLRVGFVSRNMLTRLAPGPVFSDPEFRNTRATDDANGIGIGGYLQSPPTRSYGVNLNVEF
jgi:TonB-linked SusC/RagA family outer membrane protein